MYVCMHVTHTEYQKPNFGHKIVFNPTSQSLAFVSVTVRLYTVRRVE